MEQQLFTPAALLSLLSQIDELKDKQIELTETLDGTMQLCIGDSVYAIEDVAPVVFEVEPEVVEQVDDLNEETYSDMQEIGEVEMFDTEDDDIPIEGGILSELFKTLAVGGMVRLTSKLLTPKEEKLFDKYTREHMSQAEMREARKNNIYQFRKRG